MRKFFVGLTLLVAAASSNALPGSPLLFTVETDADYPRDGHVYVGDVNVYGMRYDERFEGFAEFDLRGQSASPTPVFLSFQTSADTYQLDPYVHYGWTVNVSAYVGNNHADLSDLYPGYLGNIDTILVQDDAQKFSFDITYVYNIAVASNFDSLGIHLALQNTIFYSREFNTFALTTVAAVPEPSDALFILAGLPLILLARRRRGYQFHSVALVAHLMESLRLHLGPEHSPCFGLTFSASRGMNAVVTWAGRFLCSRDGSLKMFFCHCCERLPPMGLALIYAQDRQASQDNSLIVPQSNYLQDQTSGRHLALLDVHPKPMRPATHRLCARPRP